MPCPVKLLFDENLSPRLPALVDAVFPDSRHVRDCGLKGGTDTAIWEFARQQGFALVSKDSDFFQRRLFSDNPPPLVWLRIGNCTRNDLLNLLITNKAAILALETNPLDSP